MRSAVILLVLINACGTLFPARASSQEASRNLSFEAMQAERYSRSALGNPQKSPTGFIYQKNGNQSLNIPSQSRAAKFTVYSLCTTQQIVCGKLNIQSLNLRDLTVITVRKNPPRGSFTDNIIEAAPDTHLNSLRQIHNQQ